MVKRFLLIIITTIFLSSCAFFGSSMFPTAMSDDLEWIAKSNIQKFYILDNGLGDELLFLVFEESGTIRVAIFDTSLNMRGFLEDGNGVSTDGVGFVDFNGDFVIGQAKISKNGSTDISEFIPVPGFYNNSLIYRYMDIPSATEYYLSVAYDGNLTCYDTSWNQIYVALMPDGLSTNPLSFNIHQSDPDLIGLYFAEQNGDIYYFEKNSMFEHVTGTNTILTPTPTLSITDITLTQWVTRCNRGYFVSSMDGRYILYDVNGSRIGTIENENYSNQIVTIDYNSEYYYVLDQNRGVILKERLPF